MVTQSQTNAIQASKKILLELRNVVKAFDTPTGPFYALNGVNLKVNVGEFSALIGKSGSGKSTMINMITGIDRPTMGEVIVGGTPIHKFNEDQMATWRGKNLGVVFQFFQLLPTLTLLENVMLPMELCNLYHVTERKERSMGLLEMVGLEDHFYKFPAEISGGQAQRAAIARSFANNPDILVADEPTGNQDSKTGDAIFQIFEEFVAQGRTILMVTHDRSLATRVSRVIYIVDGEIVDEHIREALPLLKPNEQVELLSRLEPVSYSPGEVIIQQGDPAEHLYIIVKGRVVVEKTYPEGTLVKIRSLEAGQYFGEMGLIGGVARSATVRAGADTEVMTMRLDRENFQAILNASKQSKDEIIQRIRQRVMEGSLITAFPALDIANMELQADDYEILEFEPGALIIREYEKADMFYLITRGEVEILQSHKVLQNEEVIARRTEGSFFGEMGLLMGGFRHNSVRAAEGCKVELVALKRAAFRKLVKESHLTKLEIVHIMQQRFLENIQSAQK